jgi:hypothetical protein
MSDFVNYNKRTFNLPAGCKDLIDLLALGPAVAGRPAPGYGELPVKVVRGGAGTVPLQQLGEYVSKVCGSPSNIVQFIASSPEERLTISLDRTHSFAGSKLTLSVMAKNEAEEGAIRGFFEGKGLGPASGQPAPGLPVQLSYPIPALHAHSWVLAAILIEFFKVVCGLDEQAELRYCYNEFE